MTKEIIGRSGKPLTNGDSIVRLPKVIYRCADLHVNRVVDATTQTAVRGIERTWE